MQDLHRIEDAADVNVKDEMQAIYFKFDEIFTNENYVFNTHSRYYHQLDSQANHKELESEIMGLAENIDELFYELSKDQIHLNNT